MIIKKKHTNKIVKDALFLLKKWNFHKLFYTSVLIFLITFSSVSYGIYLNRNKKIDNVVHFVGDLLEVKFDFIANYISSFNSNSNTFIIDIKFKHLDNINTLINIANKRGYISEDLKIDEFPAKITFNNKKYRVKLSLTGQYLDHVESDRNSFNVEVKDGQTIMGMSKFKLLIPNTRGYLADWVGHEMQKKEGLITPRFDFITIKINGENKGLFALEESYNTDLIENNNLRDGIIFKPGLNGIVVLNKKKINNDEILKNRVQSLKNLWQSFLNNQISPDAIFDLKKFAIDYATTDLISGLHSKFTLNLRYYYNPITNLVEPISREFGFMRNSYEINGRYKTNIFTNALSDSILSFTDKKLHKKIFSSFQLQKLYTKNLNRISNKPYLDSFFKIVKSKMYEKEKLIHRESPFYSYPKRFLYSNQKIIKDFLNSKDQILFANLLLNEDDIVLEFTNTSSLPLELNYILINDSIVSKPITNNIINPNYLNYDKPQLINFDFLNNENINISNVTFFYNILGLKNNNFNHRTSKINNLPIYFNPTTMSSSLLDLDFIINDSLNNVITLRKGKYTLDKVFSVPSEYNVNFEAGVYLDLINGGGLISHSKLNFNGTETNPIVITSSDLSNTGVSVINAEDISNFNYVEIENLSNFSSNDWNLTGSLTFYNSDVIFNNCKISRNLSGDDLLNIFNSDFEIINSEFNNSFADALDADFCTGKIINTSFVNSGNDAIDISGSKLQIENVLINKSLDKALSAGENSIINGDNIKIINSEIAICSKDLSEVNITNYYLENNVIGVTAFQKKSKFGPGFLNLVNGTSKDNSINYIIESNSTCIVDKIKIIPNDKNVKNILYGIKYGKSSK